MGAGAVGLRDGRAAGGAAERRSGRGVEPGRLVHGRWLPAAPPWDGNFRSRRGARTRTRRMRTVTATIMVHAPVTARTPQRRRRPDRGRGGQSVDVPRRFRVPEDLPGAEEPDPGRDALDHAGERVARVRARKVRRDRHEESRAEGDEGMRPHPRGFPGTMAVPADRRPGQRRESDADENFDFGGARHETKDVIHGGHLFPEQDRLVPVYLSGRGRAVALFSRKNSCRISPHSPARTPPVT